MLIDGTWSDARREDASLMRARCGGAPKTYKQRAGGGCRKAAQPLAHAHHRNGIQPTDWYRFDANVRCEYRVDQVIAWLSRPPEARPHLIMLYVEETDSRGTTFPPTRRRWWLPYRGLPEDVDMVEAGPHMVLHVDDEGAAETPRKRLDLAMPHVRVYRVEGAPVRFHRAGAGACSGDLVLVPEVVWAVLPWSAVERPARNGLTHGWDPETPEMNGLSLAGWPRIAESMRVPVFENVHVYPLIAEILDLTPNPAIDGRLEVLAPIFRWARSGLDWAHFGNRYGVVFGPARP